jgi:hypothetical protein
MIMRNIFFLFFLTGFLISCNQYSGEKIRKQVIAATEKYAMNHLSNGKRSVDDDGLITLYSNGIMYRIDPSKIFVGEIDEDSKKDAIISIMVSRMPVMERPEHLILINYEGDFMVTRVIESDMKVLRIKDRIISVEVSAISPDSPMYGCESCKEVVHYQYRDGDLVKTE